MLATIDKAVVRQMLDELPDDATCDDLMYQVYVLQAVERGCGDFAAGRIVEHKDVRAHFGLPKG
jgi:predicted transcriptional regulator